ncbi:digeranylgeranylglyceryl phosphate synthase protein [Rutstroemia sp. NJR-2017a WRK4]|nr:digeranylgeranylglyceryl phosphate synthase protein [Rutstroemia sp. NJR-2017a WRK4]
MKTTFFHLHTIWLFTFSDLKTIILPSTAFGVCTALAVSIEESSQNASHYNAKHYIDVLSSVPKVMLWTWINLLPFAINNQRQPEAIEEDAINKPWRVFPSGRLSPESAKTLMLFGFFMAIITSQVQGSSLQCLALILLGFWYNNLNGSDCSFLVRNFINACGFVCFTSGAMQVAVGTSYSVLELHGWWYGIIAGIVFSTVQMQDMYDQRGDAIRNRKTVPLVLGDGLARWTIAVPVVMWCWLAPLLWNSSFFGFVLPVALGFTVAIRVLRRRTESEDKKTFRLWNLWLVSIYLLPLNEVGHLVNVSHDI